METAYFPTFIVLGIELVVPFTTKSHGYGIRAPRFQIFPLAANIGGKCARLLHLSYAKIADELNRRGVPTRTDGASWHATTVQNILKRRPRKEKAA